MKGRRILLNSTLLFGLLAPICLVGQNLPAILDPVLGDFTDEQVVTVSEEWEEMQFELPSIYNVNDEEHIDKLLDNEIISKEQREELLHYISTYGSLLHIYELVGIDGFSFTWISECPVNLGCIPIPKLGRTQYRLKAEQEIRTRFDGTSLGSRMINRMRFEINRNLLAQLVVEKDRGESLLRKAGGTGPEHLSGNITWRGSGNLRQMVLGDFRIEGGYGLSFGKSFNAFDSRFPGAEAYHPFRIVPKATSMENYAETGVGLSYKLNRFHLSVAVTHNQYDGKLVYETGDWRISSMGYGDHSSLAANIKREHLSITRQILISVWEGRWYRTGLSCSLAKLVDPLVLHEDSTLQLQQAVSKRMGFFFQGVAPDLMIDIEGCTDLANTGMKLGLTVLPSNWISFRTQLEYQNGGWILPSNLAGMGQWAGSEQFSHYLGASAQWGRGWSAAIGQRYDRKLTTRYGIPENSWDQRYWLKILHNQRLGTLTITASFRTSGSNEQLDLPEDMLLRSGLRIQYYYNVDTYSRFKLGMQITNAGNRLEQESWGLSFQAGLQGSIQRWNLPDYFIDFLVHDIDAATARITSFMRDPAGGVRMVGLYHRGFRINSGIDIKDLGPCRLWFGCLAERTLQTSGQKKFILEAVVKLRFAKAYWR